MSTQTVQITRLGAQGDGIAETGAGPLYVPFVLPGETVTVEVRKNRGRLIAVDQPSAVRVDPPCPYFGPGGSDCGGCALQHMQHAEYEAWKRQLVVDAFAARGIEADIGALVQCRSDARRRAVFTARKTQHELVFGYHRAATHRIVSVDHCMILSPAIEKRLPVLRSLAEHLATDTKPFQISVLDTVSGLDVTIRQNRLPDRLRQSAIGLAMEIGLARLSLNDEILIETQKPCLDFSGVLVFPPPDTFVQASQDAQEAMTELVAQHLGGLRKTMDLFSGCGPFALQLASDSAVHAVESDGAALSALDHAARHHPGLRPVSVERRDLFRRPVRAEEFTGFDGAVFDPPRAGAQAQATELARASIKKIAAVSCNPATLARDLRILIDGGFQLTSVTPIDQFLWTAHVEAVALLER